MLSNFKRTAQVSLLISVFAIAAFGAFGVASIVHATPNFVHVFESPYTTLVLANKLATPASGNYNSEAKPVKFTMQNEGAFTNVFAPNFLNSTGNVIRTAQVGRNTSAPRSVLQVIAVHAELNTLDKLLPDASYCPIKWIPSKIPVGSGLPCIGSKTV